MAEKKARDLPVLLQQLLSDRITQFHLLVEWILLVVLHQFTQSLKLCCANGEQPVFAFDAAMFYLFISPVCKQHTHTHVQHTHTVYFIRRSTSHSQWQIKIYDLSLIDCIKVLHPIWQLTQNRLL